MLRAMRLEGRAALVTGAASGIGRTIARRFADEGARVALADLDGDAAAACAKDLGGEAIALAVDVTDAADVEAAVASVAERFGRLDTVVNNAGIPMVGAAHELAEDDWDRVLAANLKSVYLVSRAAWPRLCDAGGGSITSTASIAGVWGTKGQAGYAAAKAGVIMLTKCMALDGAEDRIRANCVCPGFVATPMLERFLAAQPDPEAARNGATALHPLGRLGEPADIADAFVYLASDDARWVTGTALTVDGGLTSGIWR
jgi:NAD(P)-dependent dehydrogenase (short-subunit alcohol dehydrogenase family)